MSFNEGDVGFSSDADFFDTKEILSSPAASVPATPRPLQLHSNHTSPLTVRTRKLSPIPASFTESESSDHTEDSDSSHKQNRPLVDPLDPLINGNFPSFESLRTRLNEITKELGYALRIRGSKKNKAGVVCKKQLECDMGRKPQTSVKEEHRKRQTATKATDCPWRGYARSTDGKWNLVVKDDTHNHRTTSSKAHPLHRRFDASITDFIANETRRGLPVYKTVNELRNQNPDLTIERQDVYNARHKSRKHQLQGRTPLEAFIAEIKSRDEWDCYGQYDEWDRLEFFFFRHRKSQYLLQNFHYILFMDCTYKTNRYGMPLLVVTGLTACKKASMLLLPF